MSRALPPAPSTARLANEHIHQRQEEGFDVVEGLLRVGCRGDSAAHWPGEVVVIPAGAPHASDTTRTHQPQNARQGEP